MMERGKLQMAHAGGDLAPTAASPGRASRHRHWARPPREWPREAAKALIRHLDRSLRHRLGIEDFTEREDCILRIESARSDRGIALSDGVAIGEGDPVLEIHFWNEHMPPMERRGCTVAWARLVGKRMHLSLKLLARHVQQHPETLRFKAIRGRLAFSLRQGRKQLDRLADHYGFDLIDDDRPRTLTRRLHDAGENILFWMILWTFNPTSLKYSKFLRPRREMWMSLDRLVRDYGEPGTR